MKLDRRGKFNKVTHLLSSQLGTGQRPGGSRLRLERPTDEGDADWGKWGDDVDTGRSTSGHVLMMPGAAICGMTLGLLALGRSCAVRLQGCLASIGFPKRGVNMHVRFRFVMRESMSTPSAMRWTELQQPRTHLAD